MPVPGRKLGLGWSKTYLKVYWSTISRLTVASPAVACQRIQEGGEPRRSELRKSSLKAYAMSSVVAGTPSDHFSPLRIVKVWVWASALLSQLSNTPGWARHKRGPANQYMPPAP